jgi:endonuclease YncB( thermonuclease family)
VVRPNLNINTHSGREIYEESAVTKDIFRSIKHFPTLTISLFTLLWVLSSPASAQTVKGRVVGISDGDTITVLDASNQQHKIRLNGIDAPESSQGFGQASKRNLSNLIFGKEVTVSWRKIDRYGRIVGTVMIGSMNVNLEQLKAGLAWYFRKYASDVPPADRPIYDRAEQEARTARRGLWQQSNPTPPWEFRHPDQVPTPSTYDSRSSGQIIGNRNSHVYHRPDCPDYQKVSERNRIYFSTTAEAERAGFRVARNCR